MKYLLLLHVDVLWARILFQAPYRVKLAGFFFLAEPTEDISGSSLENSSLSQNGNLVRQFLARTRNYKVRQSPSAKMSFLPSQRTFAHQSTLKNSSTRTSQHTLVPNFTSLDIQPIERSTSISPCILNSAMSFSGWKSLTTQ